MKSLMYDIIQASMDGATLHPQDQMKALGFEVEYAVPQSFGDCWWFLVKDYDFELPSYLKELGWPASDFEYWGYKPHQEQA